MMKFKLLHFDINKILLLSLLGILLMCSVASAIVDTRWSFDRDYVTGDVPIEIVFANKGAVANVTDVTKSTGNYSLYVNDSSIDSPSSTYAGFKVASPLKYVKNGKIEFDLNITPGTNDRLDIYGKSTTGTAFHFRFANGNIQNATNPGTIATYQSSTWNHYIMEFNNSTQTVIFSKDDAVIGTYNYASEVTLGVQELRILSDDSHTASYYIDNITVYDYLRPTQPDTLRKFPYPYYAAYSISSDYDDMSEQEFFDAYDFLNTNELIGALGQGVNLECGQNVWLWGPYVGLKYYEYTNGSLVPSTNRQIFMDYINAGYFDGWHTFGDPSIDMTNATQRALYTDALAQMTSEGVRLSYWIDHGGAEMFSNIGTTSANFKGDDPNNITAYHWNITSQSQPVIYLWEGNTTEEPYQPNPLTASTLDDGYSIYTFPRSVGRASSTGTPENVDADLSAQLSEANIKKVLAREGYYIMYTHLGTTGSSNVTVDPIFGPQTLAALRTLSDYAHGTNGKDKVLYVTTTAKLLRYAEVSEYMQFTYTAGSPGRIDIHNVSSPVRTFVPTVNDLEGITFYVPHGTKIYLAGVDVSAYTVENAADSTGQVSVGFPVKRLVYPYPKSITMNGTYKIYSNGSTSWTRTTDRPSSVDILPITVIPSSGDVTVSVVAWSVTEKVWNESSESHNITTSHVIGGFPANTDIQIKRDDINYGTATSNETGYIEWVYDGGFSESEHTFSIECHSIEYHDFNASLTSGAYPLTTQFTTSSDGIDAYYWDFENDGVIDSTKQNPAHTYGQTGTYSVNLTVHTSEGNVSIVKPDYITVENPAFSEDPLAWFNWVFSYLFGRF